jgi:hypothetical protein
MFDTNLFMAEVPRCVTVGCYTRQRKKSEGDRQRERHYTNDLCCELRSGVDKRVLQLINQGALRRTSLMPLS